MRCLLPLFLLLPIVAFSQISTRSLAMREGNKEDSLELAMPLPFYGQDLELYPNTASDNTRLNLFAFRKGAFHLSLIDLGERVLWEDSFDFERGENHFPLSLYGIDPGWYWVRVEPDGIGKEFFLPLLIER